MVVRKVHIGRETFENWEQEEERHFNVEVTGSLGFWEKNQLSVKYCKLKSTGSVYFPECLSCVWSALYNTSTVS